MACCLITGGLIAQVGCSNVDCKLQHVSPEVAERVLDSIGLRSVVGKAQIRGLLTVTDGAAIWHVRVAGDSCPNLADLLARSGSEVSLVEGEKELYLHYLKLLPGAFAYWWDVEPISALDELRVYEYGSNTKITLLSRSVNAERFYYLHWQKNTLGDAEWSVRNSVDDVVPGVIVGRTLYYAWEATE